MRPRCILKEGIVQWAQECQPVMTVSTHDQRGTLETNGQLTNTGDKEWEGPKEREPNAEDRNSKLLKFLKGRKGECACPGQEGKERAL